MTTPQSVELNAARLRVSWDDLTREFDASTLRRACRCGGCRADRAAGRPLLGDSAALDGAEPIGAYALQLRFQDGHDRGIYPWSYLRELAT